jgi:DNA modification methylase
MKVDKKQLDFFIKNRKIEDKESELYKRILKNIDKTINDFKSEQKKKQRLKKINDLEEKRKLLDVLNKDQIKTLPDWIIKEKLENCFVMGSTNKTILTPSGKKYHIDNKLNDLTGGEWSYFLRSVINTRYGTKGEDSFAHEIRKIHPSPKPPQLMSDIIRFFTKKNELILDYFMGVGGTLLGASITDRNALGIDLSSKYISAYKKASKKLNLKEQTTIKGDSLKLLEHGIEIKKYLKNKKFSLIAIDPPYGDMMSRKKTGEAIKKNQSTDATPFTLNKKDLGNMEWSTFIKEFVKSIEFSMNYLKDRGHVVVFIKDLQPKEGNTNLLHADIIEHLSKIKNLNYLGMKIWSDESINLYPYGYPFSFVSNQLHQYIMFFRKKL